MPRPKSSDGWLEGPRFHQAHLLGRCQPLIASQLRTVPYRDLANAPWPDEDTGLKVYFTSVGKVGGVA